MTRSTTVAILLLAGCNAWVAPAVHDTQIPSPYALAVARAGERVRTSMEGTSRAHKLLYVSNTVVNAEGVEMYSYRTRMPMGMLQGTLSYPMALCRDAAQNVYVTNADRHQVLEYAHGRQKAMRILADPSGNPLGCAVDRKSGNLAVANFGTYGAGQIVIYERARGVPKAYSAPNICYYWFPAYDDNGDLFVDGEPCTTGVVFVAEMPAGTKRFVDLSLNQTIEYPGGVQWDGSYLAIGDQRTNEIYRFSINGSTGTLQDTVALQGAIDVFEFWISNREVVGADHGQVSGGFCTDSATYYWKYPGGGAPVASISGPECASGVTVSSKQ